MKFARKHSILFLLMTAVSISFLGSLPPGTTNVLTLQLASQSIYKALLFSFGCLFGEMIYVSLCVVMMQRVMRFQGVMKALEWISFGVILTLSAAAFIAAIYNTPMNSENTNTLMAAPFISGLGLMIINPVQIPFWLGWTTVLYEKNILKSRLTHHLAYIVGAGIGSLFASFLFVMAGEFLSRYLLALGSMWNYVLGAIFLTIAVFQLISIFSRGALRVPPARFPHRMESPH